MSSKSNMNRKSDVGVPSSMDYAAPNPKVDPKRRQTIAEMSMKENSDKKIKTSIEPKNRSSSASSQFKHHSAPVSLGSATSYYFAGAPQTPVQKLVRSEQQKLILNATTQFDEEDDTGNILLNQSYLSSSSSSGGRNDSGEAEVLNTSVLSDTTELTASNFVVLAATQRTTAEDIRKAIEERRQPLAPLMQNEEQDFALAGHKRRQTLTEGMIHPKPSVDSETATRRRESMSILSLPRATLSPADLPNLVQTMKNQRMQRERNKFADFQRRQSDGSFKGVPPAPLRRSSMTPSTAIDNTNELSISGDAMQTLLNMSAYGNQSNLSLRRFDSESLHFIDPSCNHATNQEIRLSTDAENVNSHSMTSPGDHLSVSKADSSPSARSTAQRHEDHTAHRNELLSPARNTRSSAKKRAAAETLPNYEDPSVQSLVKLTSKSSTGNTTEYTSPAKNTRSSAKKKTVEQTKKNDLSSSPGQSLFQSPPKIKRRTPTKSPQRRENSGNGDAIQTHLSPAKCTRSATKKLPQESNVEETISALTVASNAENTISIVHLLDGLPAMGQDSEDSTVSFGNVLDGLVDPKNVKTTASPINTSTDTQSTSQRIARSNRKERESFPSTLVDIESSPARNTRSAQKKQLMMSSTETPQMIDHQAKSVSTIDFSVPTEDETTISLGDILSGTALKTSAQTKPDSTTKGSQKSVNTSQDSTASLGDLLNEYLSQDCDRQDESLHSDHLGLSTGTRSKDSFQLRSTVSKASTIDTPIGMTREAPILDSKAEGLSLPRSPPSTIRFTVDEVSRLVEPSSSSATASMSKSPRRKLLTPSKLAPSPRRFVHSGIQNKLYKTTLTPSQLPASPYRLTNPVGARVQGNAYRSSLTPTKLQPSPLRSKRSFGNDEIGPVVENAREPLSAFKRQKQFEELQNCVKESFAVGLSPTPKPRNLSLQSVLRHPGQSSFRSGTKRVGFRSPTFAEFNKTSPAERLTPMITRKNSFADNLPTGIADHANDIEYPQDSTMVNAHDAGSTPFSSRIAKRVGNVDDSDMSVDSASLFPTDAEPTVTLETDMSALFRDAPDDQNSIFGQNQFVEENTMELETNIASLLNVPSTNTESFHVGRRSIVFEDEPTVELESNINALFYNDDAGDRTLFHSQSQSPLASHRFSIAPSRRLSLSIDGSFDHQKTADVQVLTNSYNGNATPEDNVFDLKVREIIDINTMDMSQTMDSRDFLVSVYEVMRENGISETMDVFTRQVLEMIVNQTEPEVDPDAIVDISQENVERCTALQRHVRTGENENIHREIRSLVESLIDSSMVEWLTWLVSATEQLNHPIDEKRDIIVDEIQRLDTLCYNTEQCLATITSKSVQKARRKNMENRKVRWSFLYFRERHRHLT
jgi:hypothetical protein